MYKLDDFLIDKLFQPLCDLFYPRVTCYSLSGFFFIGGCVFLIAGCEITDPLMIFVDFVTFAFWFIWAQRANNLDKSAHEGVIPVDRVRDVAVRSIYLFMLLISLLERVFPSMFQKLGFDISGLFSFKAAFTDIAWALATLGLYFLACRKMPPKRKQTYVQWQLA